LIEQAFIGWQFKGGSFVDYLDKIGLEKRKKSLEPVEDIIKRAMDISKRASRK